MLLAIPTVSRNDNLQQNGQMNYNEIYIEIDLFPYGVAMTIYLIFYGIVLRFA